MNLTDNGIEEINTRAFSRNQLLGKIFITKTPHLYTKVRGCLSVYVSKIIEGEWAMGKSANSVRNINIAESVHKVTY